RYRAVRHRYARTRYVLVVTASCHRSGRATSPPLPSAASARVQLLPAKTPSTRQPTTMIRRRVLALALVAFTGEALQAPSTGRLIHRHLETSATSKVQTPRVDLSKHVQPTAAEISAAFAETLVKQHETRLKTDKKHARDLQQAQAVTDEVQALLDETRQAFQESLAKTHEAKLEMQKEHAAQLNALQSELRETQKAFGDQLVKAHEQKINLINQHSVELRQADARTDAVREEMQEVQAAFTDYMARKQNELMERTTSLQKDVDSARSEAEAKQGELDQIQEAFNEHTQQTDDLIEAQGDELRKARETLQAVGASAIAALKE
ncbi:unnamed protein product, partial [Pelagomonas calceolata]